MKITRIAGACIGGAALTFALALPAHAADSENGSKSCSTGYTVAITSRTSGNTTHYYNGSPTSTTYHGSTLRTRTTGSSVRTANWQAYTSDVMDHAATYSYCAG